MFNKLEKNKELTSLVQLDLTSLYVFSGKVTHVMDDIIQYWMINGSIEEQQKKLKEGIDIKKKLEAARAMKSEVLAAKKIYNLNNPAFLDYVKNMAEQETNDKMERERKVRSNMFV